MKNTKATVITPKGSVGPNEERGPEVELFGRQPAAEATQAEIERRERIRQAYERMEQGR